MLMSRKNAEHHLFVSAIDTLMRCRFIQKFKIQSSIDSGITSLHLFDYRSWIS